MSEQKEFSFLPPGWVRETLGQITEGYIEQLAPTEGATFLYIDIGSIDNKAKRISNPKTLLNASAPSRARQRLKSHDVLVSMTRPNLNAVAIVYDAMDGAIGSTGFHVLRTRWISPYWIYYLVQTKNFVEAMSGLVQGALYPAVRPKDIQAYNIPIAPLGEQKRIVDEIEKQFSRLDAGTERLQHVASKLQLLHTATLIAAAQGRLVPTEAQSARSERRNYEPAHVLLQRILRERRTKWEADQLAKMKVKNKKTGDNKWKDRYREPSIPDINNLPNSPEGWTWATVEQLASFGDNSITDGPFGSNLKTEHYTSEGPRVIRLQNIGDGVFNDILAHISQERFERLLKHQVKANDIVIAALGETLPRACIVPSSVGAAIVKADCIRLEPNSNITSSKYLNISLNSKPTRIRTASIVHGVGRPRLNLGEIKSIALPLPPLLEQQRIIAEVERRLSVIEELKRLVTNALRRATILRQKILRQAFAGKLVPQDPADEPADILLTRIRQERERSETEDRAVHKKESRKMNIKHSAPTTRRELIAVLREANAPITPEQLFKAAGYQPDEVEDFYAALKRADKDQLFTQKVLANGEVFLRALP